MSLLVTHRALISTFTYSLIIIFNLLFCAHDTDAGWLAGWLQYYTISNINDNDEKMDATDSVSRNAEHRASSIEH